MINHDLLPLCFQISELVAPVVNSMSPEGFIPDDYMNIIGKSSKHIFWDSGNLSLNIYFEFTGFYETNHVECSIDLFDEF